jgi:beta-glucan synthesis-associated protein KRE6
MDSISLVAKHMNRILSGYIEVSLSLPGSASAPGFWPAAWTMGNLVCIHARLSYLSIPNPIIPSQGRAGYGATTDGMWPYTYDSCDTGTFPNQTSKSGAPAAAATGSPEGGTISFLPGQRVSACTCSGGDHPGPSVSVGRGVPEIDILEAQVDVSRMQGQVSQSAQIAPFDYQYTWDENSPATTIYNKNLTVFNSYKGGIYQQAESAVTDINSTNYGGNGFATYGFEWFSNPSDRDKGFVTWYSEGQPAWTLTTSSIGPDSKMEIGQRLISEEPMVCCLFYVCCRI